MYDEGLIIKVPVGKLIIGLHLGLVNPQLELGGLWRLDYWKGWAGYLEGEGHSKGKLITHY